jgi:hypothetical protein
MKSGWILRLQPKHRLCRFLVGRLVPAYAGRVCEAKGDRFLGGKVGVCEAKGDRDGFVTRFFWSATGGDY